MAIKDLQLDARSLRDLVDFERPVQSRSPRSGQGGSQWERYANARARVEPLAGREFWQAQQVNSTTTHRVTLRWIPGVVADHRLVLADGRALNITSAVDVENRHRVLILQCGESS